MGMWRIKYQQKELTMQRIQFLKHRVQRYFIIKISYESWTGIAIRLECVLCYTFDPGFESHQCLYTHVCTSTWIKKVHYHANHQEVSRCCTSGESEESIARKRGCIQVRDPPWLWDPTVNGLGTTVIWNFPLSIQLMQLDIVFQNCTAHCRIGKG